MAIKKTFLVALSFVAGISLVAHATVPRSSQIRWTSYRNDRLSFKIQVPAAWRVLPRSKAVGFSSPAKGGDHVAIGVLRSADRNATIEQEARKEFLFEGKPEYWLQSYTKVGGRKALRIVRNKTKKPNVKVVEFYIDGPNGVYLLQCLGPCDKWPLYRPLFTAMINNFHFLS